MAGIPSKREAYNNDFLFVKMGDNIPVTKTTRFNASHIGSCGGFIRIVIVVVGIVGIILGSVGSPHDLSSRNYSNSYGSREFYGYGLGYIKEPLNIAFIVIMIITWLFDSAFVVALIFEASHGIAIKLNRILYLCFGLTILGGVTCGIVGTFYFWGNCCNVSPPDRSTDNWPFLRYIRSYYYRDGSSTNWCRCTFLKEADISEYMDLFVFQPELSGVQFAGAWPHHFVTHCLGLAFAFLSVILHFIATCIV